MKVLVCIKQVPDTEAHPEIDAGGVSIRENSIAFRMNRYDDYALEEALLIKDSSPGAVVDVISVGPDRAIAVLKKGLEKGADNAVLIRCTGRLPSAFETATLIARYAAGKNYDLIFAGIMSEDAMQCQVGPMTASLLSIPCAVSVVKSGFDFSSRTVTAESELEGGVIETLQLAMPCLLTVQTGINRPRYPSLSNVMRGRGIDVLTLDASTSPGEILTETVSLVYPPGNTKGIVIEGNSGEKADKLLSILHERGFI